MYINTLPSPPTFRQILKRYQVNNTRSQSSLFSIEPSGFNYVCSDQQRTLRPKQTPNAVLQLQQVKPAYNSLTGKSRSLATMLCSKRYLTSSIMTVMGLYTEKESKSLCLLHLCPCKLLEHYDSDFIKYINFYTFLQPL